ncbi:MAG: class I SAM-dependent methyltransferase, partial [Armatimonadetes bacterium]|nr:class I SAM-dependent methyltransferase [Armatimonadota bacterium]
MSLSTLGGSASALCALLMTVPTIAVVAAEKEQAREICDATGVKGGLIVHLGCGDGKLTAALRPNDSYLVHGLDAETGNVARARAHIQSLGLYGKVSVERWTGSRLPYADNLVTLLVSADLGKVPMAEVLRVLAPSGVAYLKQGDAWRKTVKPRPGGVDEWTHFLHDASGNPVAHHQIVGPPRLLQWTEDPKYARSHEHTPSVAAVVSSAGRVFYIVDEAPASSLLCSPE